MAAAGGHWGYQELSEFLTAPAKYVKGTKMVFVGLPKPEDRAHVIAYLRSLNDSPLALPEAPKVEEKAEEAKEEAAEEKAEEKEEKEEKADKKSAKKS